MAADSVGHVDEPADVDSSADVEVDVAPSANADVPSADADPADTEVGGDQESNVDVTEPNQADSAPSDYPANPVGPSAGSADAPADDASSAESDAGEDSDQEDDVDTTEVDQSAAECEELQRDLAKSVQRIVPLKRGNDTLCLSFEQRGRKLDQLKRERALNHQELHRLQSSYAAHIDELRLLQAERELLIRDHQVQLDYLRDFVIGLPPSVGHAYDKRRREQSSADPSPTPSKPVRVADSLSSALGSSAVAVTPVCHTSPCIGVPKTPVSASKKPSTPKP